MVDRSVHLDSRSVLHPQFVQESAVVTNEVWRDKELLRWGTSDPLMVDASLA